ncbi:MAG: methylase involved in ubiquinone/menaquinone biosynthesis [uncultured archaeon A07HR60]|nr:MAG: methylase involved in ubiquinone/menaquinone biosynthesis [uncultured archaeon A07HR60]
MTDTQESPSDSASPRETYDRIAAHFSKTRAYPWPEVTAFLEGRSAGTAVDIGCGNGRHVEPLVTRVDSVVGLDASRGLLEEARDRAAERGYGDRMKLVHGDAQRLPLQADSVGLAVYVATLHHLQTRASRRQSLSEVARILSGDGVALVSAWSTTHERFDRQHGFDTTVDWTLPGGKRVPRFYHIYDPAEFQADIAASDLRLLEFETSSGNCYATVTPETAATPESTGKTQ